MKFAKIAAVTAFVSAMALPTASNAAVIIDVSQVGANVIATVSGTLSLSGLIDQGTYTLGTSIRGSSTYIGTGSSGAAVMAYSGFSGPFAIGSSSNLFSPTSTSGSLFGFNAGSFGSPYVFLAPNYISGSALSSTATFANQTLASLGLTNGQYVYKSRADSLTFNIGTVAPAVPEPASWAMMIVGLGAVGAMMRRRQRVAVTFA